MKPKPYHRMTAAELALATARFDTESTSALPGKPLSPKQRAQWAANRPVSANAKPKSQKRGRPKLGNGAKRVLISLESDLLRRTDQYAKSHHTTRSQLIASTLKKLLAS